MALTSPRIAVLSTSLSGRSRSRQLCRCAYDHLLTRSGDPVYLDLQDVRILPYGMAGSEGQEVVEKALTSAQGIILGFPVYNYTMSASLKAVIERFGGSFEGKVVGLILSAGGRSSYMSAADVMTSLMFDFRTWMVPRMVYATKGDFQGDVNRTVSPEIRDRTIQLADATYAAAWQHLQPVPGLGPPPAP